MLSSEAICRLALPGNKQFGARQAAFLKRLRELLTSFEVTPVLVVRRQDEFVRSLYQEHVERGWGQTARMGFKEYLEHSAPDKPRFLERLQLFRSVFGSVQLLVYEHLRDGRLPDAFFRELGFDLSHVREKRETVRQSPSVGKTLLKREFNAWITSDRQNDRVLRWLRSRHVGEVLGQYFPADLTLWPSEEERWSFLRSFEEENNQILDEFGSRHLGRLFPKKSGERSQDRTMTTAEAHEAVAQIVRDQSSGLRRILGNEAVSSLIVL